MRELEKNLWADYNKVSKQLESLELKDVNYNLLLEERDKIRNELLKLEQANMETNVKKVQIVAEDKRENIRNCITIGTAIVSSMIGVWTVIKTFKFDQDSTVTSTLGSNILKGAIPKMFKR